MAGWIWTKMLAQAALLGVFFLTSESAYAQSASGSISIRLTDLYSKPLQGVRVSLRNRSTGETQGGLAVKNGVYRFVGLEPGNYALDAWSPLLGVGELDDIEITAGGESHIQAALALKPSLPRKSVAEKDQLAEPRVSPHARIEGVTPRETLETKLEISSAAATPNLLRPSVVPAALFRTGRMSSMIGGASIGRLAASAGSAALQAIPKPEIVSPEDPATESFAMTLPMDRLQELPLAGSDRQDALMQPPSSQSSRDEQSEERRHDASSVVVDGASTRVAFGNAYTGRARGPSSSLMGPATNDAALRQVETGFAQDGFQSVATARGGNRLHGHASVFDRQNIWAARNPFTQWVQQSAPGSATTVPVFSATPYSPGDREIIWSVSAGGPLLHKFTWFAAVDRADRDAPAVSTVKHPEGFFAQPSNDQMQVLSARLGLSSANPVVAGLGAYSGMLQTLSGLLGPAARTSKQASGFGRLDWAATGRQRFVLEGSGGLWDSPGGGLARASETYGTHSYGSSRVDDQWVFGRWESALTSRFFAITQASVGRRFVAMPAESLSSFEQSLDVKGLHRLPQIVVDSRDGFTIGTPARFGPGAYPDEHLYEAQEAVNWEHANGFFLRAGFDVRHNEDGTGLLRNQTGTYHYASIENFASDALAFAAFGLSGELNPMDQHNCDQTGRVWRDTAGTLHGLGYLPCYSWYSQTMGPANWWLASNDWASYVTSQWRFRKTFLASLGMRWDLEQAPPAMPLLDNPDLPLTQKMPKLGSEWAPRASLAWGSRESRRPVLRVGYGMHYGRTANRTFENALTQTGSPKGDLDFLMRPTADLNGGGAPPFPYVLSGEPATAFKPAAIEFAPGFRNGEIHQGVVAAEETLPGGVRVEAGAVATLGRRLPMTEDANIDLVSNPRTITYAIVDANGSGPIKSPRVTVPFFASWPSATSPTGFAGRLNPGYQRITEIFSRANSTYEAAVVRVTRTGRDGLMLHARYVYAHTADWNPNDSVNMTRPSVFDPTNLREEYGPSDLDVRHSASIAAIWEPRWKLHGETGRLANNWMISGIGSFRSGLPYTMRTAGSLAREFDRSGVAIVGLEPGMNGYGGEDRVYGVGRNTYRYPATWKADLRLGKRFNLGSMRQLELLAESFNLFNHQNTTEIETVGYSIESGSVNGGLPSLNFLTGLKSGQTEFGRPLNINATDFFRPRKIQFGLRMRF